MANSCHLHDKGEASIPGCVAVRYLKAIGHVGRALHEPNDDAANRHSQNKGPDEHYQTDHQEIKQLNVTGQLSCA